MNRGMSVGRLRYWLSPPHYSPLLALADVVSDWNGDAGEIIVDDVARPPPANRVLRSSTTKQVCTA